MIFSLYLLKFSYCVYIKHLIFVAFFLYLRLFVYAYEMHETWELLSCVHILSNFICLLKKNTERETHTHPPSFVHYLFLLYSEAVCTLIFTTSAHIKHKNITNKPETREQSRGKKWNAYQNWNNISRVSSFDMKANNFFLVGVCAYNTMIAMLNLLNNSSATILEFSFHFDVTCWI